LGVHQSVDTLTTREQIAARWHVFLDVQFPSGCVELEPNGICLVSTDSYTAGCISSYIDAPLPPDKISILQCCHLDLEYVLQADLPDHVREYFAELADMAKAVLDDVL
jgi:hypothetical protein